MTLWEYMQNDRLKEEDYTVMDEDYNNIQTRILMDPKHIENECLTRIAKILKVRNIYRSDIGKHIIISVGATDIIRDHLDRLAKSDIYIDNEGAFDEYCGIIELNEVVVLEDLFNIMENDLPEYQGMIEILEMPPDKNRRKTLLGYLKKLPEGEKVHVDDFAYGGDVVFCAHNGENLSNRDKLMNRIAKLVRIEEIHPRYAPQKIIVDFFDLVYEHAYDLVRAGFYSKGMSTEEMIGKLVNHINEYVLENDLERFVKILEQ